ncbi:MAG: hypothetical protein NWR36_04660, partial [Opitutales bacterium]|nr:hypothetical protein [Opitutales bacterium]
MKQPIDSAKDVANAAGDAISKTASFFTSTIIGIGKSVFHPISTAGNSHRKPAPGTAPGIEHYLEKEGAETPVRITVVDYGADFYDTNEYSDIGEALNLPRKEAQKVRWINVDGLNPKIVDRVCKHFGVHT